MVEGNSNLGSLENRQEREHWQPLFSLGLELFTRGTEETIQKARQGIDELLYRHTVGDWGDLPEIDRERNYRALEHGWEIVSAYTLPTGVTIWICTSANRTQTTVTDKEIPHFNE